MLRVSLILFIVVSVAVLYAETSPALVPTGPASEHCQRVVSAYCSDKNSRQDPGCFVLTAAGQPVSPARPLQFWCSGADCFGHGDNFGSASSKRECGSQSQGLELGSPFQSSADLAQSYRRVPNLLTSRGSRQRQSDVCRRIECAGILTALGSGSGSGSVASTLAPLLWYYAELLIGVGFTAELLLRLWVAASFREHASNALTWVDVLSVVPFFAELAYAGGSAVVDFSVLPSAPLPVFLTLAKSLKVRKDPSPSSIALSSLSLSFSSSLSPARSLTLYLSLTHSSFPGDSPAQGRPLHLCCQVSGRFRQTHPAAPRRSARPPGSLHDSLCHPVLRD